MIEIVKKIEVDETQLCYLYMERKYSTRSLAKLFKISQSKVCSVLKSNKVKTRLNEHKYNCQNNLKHGYNLLTKKYKEIHPECEVCGWDETTVDLHHIIPLSIGGQHEKENLICLCPNCHRKAHKGLLNNIELLQIKVNERR